MTSGIFGASVTTITDGTTAHAPDVLATLTSIIANGINNDSGAIQTDGSGGLSVAGLTTSNTGLANLAAKSQSINGSSSGTFTLYETFTGTLKVLLGWFNNYKNAGSALSITLNTAFTRAALVIALGTNGLQFLHIGAAQSINVLTALNVAGGSQSSTTTMPGYSIGQIINAFEVVKEPGGNASPATGFIVVIGF